MAQESSEGGMVALYGVAIGDALSTKKKEQTPTDKLVMLRDQAKAIINTQGDLVAALRDLETEIARRGDAKAAPVPAVERLVAQIDGLALSDKVKGEIEQALQKAVMAEIAKIDKGGDMVASPLSQIKAFGSGTGGHTAGITIAARSLK
jgi:Domain of unknown function (DUF1843)